MEDLEGKTAQLLAVMPSMPSDSMNLSNSVSPLLRLSDATQMSQLLPGETQCVYSTSSSSVTKSPSPGQQDLDPNARVFNPMIAN